MGCVLPDRHELLGIFVRQRAQQNGVNDAEDRAVRANAECESENRNRGEGRIFRQHPQAVTHILSKVSDHVAPSLCAHRHRVLWNAALHAFKFAA